VRCKGKSVTSNDTGKQNHFRTVHKIPELHTWKARNQGTVEKQTFRGTVQTHTHMHAPQKMLM